MTIASHLKDGVLPLGIFKKISKMLGVHSTMVNWIWKNYGQYASQALSMPDAHFFHRGRTHVYWPDKTILDHVKSTPISQQRTRKDIAHIIGMSIYL